MDFHDNGDTLEGFGGDVQLIALPATSDHRGELVEFNYALLPFLPQRTFVIGNVPRGTVRGGHAHKACQQLLTCLKGRIIVDVVSRSHRAGVVLDDGSRALYVNAGIWTQQRYDEDDTLLLVLTSLPFDPGSYLPEPSR